MDVKKNIFLRLSPRKKVKILNFCASFEDVSKSHEIKVPTIEQIESLRLCSLQCDDTLELSHVFLIKNVTRKWYDIEPLMCSFSLI